MNIGNIELWINYKRRIENKAKDIFLAYVTFI